MPMIHTIADLDDCIEHAEKTTEEFISERYNLRNFIRQQKRTKQRMALQCSFASQQSKQYTKSHNAKEQYKTFQYRTTQWFKASSDACKV